MAQRELLVMRKDAMWLVHPATDFSKNCSLCDEPVGIYPSGQISLAKYEAIGEPLALICHVCYDARGDDWTNATLAPGAMEEVFESVESESSPLEQHVKKED